MSATATICFILAGVLWTWVVVNSVAHGHVGYHQSKPVERPEYALPYIVNEIKVSAEGDLFKVVMHFDDGHSEVYLLKEVDWTWLFGRIGKSLPRGEWNKRVFQVEASYR